MSKAAATADPGTLERLLKGLRVIALKRLRDADAAEEAVQEILARTLQLLHDGRLRHPEEFAPIAYGVARHVLADHVRRCIREQRLVPLSEAADRQASASDALAPLIAEEERGRLRRAWKQLSSDDQEILSLTYFEQVTPAELASKLAMPAERIRKRKSRALARLRAAFFKDDVAAARARAAPSGHATDADAMNEVVAASSRTFWVEKE
ncbi:MAG: RNA polymerase sigma factor [Gemmatimonadota bacterium]